ncbi:MAG: OprO/OprP family phosphate-selective porin [Steroidobacterales bacterium]
MQFSRLFMVRRPARASYLVPVVLAVLLGSPFAAIAATETASDADSARDIDSLRQQLQQEQERLRLLEQRLAADEAARAAAPGATVAPAPDANALVSSFGADGFTLRSADGANAIHLRGNVSVDGRYFSDSYTPATADTWLIRRLRPTLEGTLANHFDYRIMPDFAQGKSIVQDAWGDVRIAPWLIVQFGKFKAPVGLERLQLEQFARFIEPSLTADLLPYRDLGLRVGGSFDKGVLSYDLGLFDGVIDSGSTDGNSTADTNSTGKFTWDGRLFAKPFVNTDLSVLKGLGLGVAGTYVNDSGIATATTTTSLLANYKTTGQQGLLSYRANTAGGGIFNNATIAQGIERRLTPQFYYYYRSVGLLGEYVQENQQVHRQLSASTARAATLRNTAWQLQASWFLTGEDEAYDKATPRRDFGFGQGGAGAWELVARYHELQFDDVAFTGGANSFANPATAPSAAHAVGVGLNWYLNRNFKAQLDYELTRFNGGGASGDRPDERVLTSQFALIF